MQKFTICAFVLVVATVVSGRPDDKYTTKFDNIDVDAILKNKRLLNNYIKCLMETGSCTPDGDELKRVLPDALATECSKCSAKQKEFSRKVLRYVIDNDSETWDKLEKKYDPTGNYKKTYCELLKKEKFDTGAKCA